MTTHIDTVALVHTKKIGNIVADSLAQLAFVLVDQVWVEDAPPQLSFDVECCDVGAFYNALVIFQ